MNVSLVDARRRPFGVAVIGGPTVVLDIGGLRLLTDPTFDPPRDYGTLRKNRGPAVRAGDLGDVDVVLLSHDDHADNLDESGRAFALRAPLTLTSPSAARRLGEPALGLVPWKTHALSDEVRVTAVPAQHGPTDAERTPEGFINADVTGFVIEAADGRVVYCSGDNASLRIVTEIHDRFPRIDVAVLHAGDAKVEQKFRGRPLSLSAERAAAAAETLDARAVVVAHDDGWTHFTEGPAAVEAAFDRAGISAVLDTSPLGRWCAVGGR